MSAEELTGTVRREPFGPGTFVFDADQGGTYALAEAPPALLRDGLRVRLRGRERNDLLGFGLTGAPALEVLEFTALE